MFLYVWWRFRLKCYIRRKTYDSIKVVFAIGSPYVSFTSGINYSYVSQFVSYQTANITSRSYGMRVPTVNELNLLKTEIQAFLMGGSLLVWATNNGEPVIALISRKKDIKVVSGSPNYSANIICISLIKNTY